MFKISNETFLIKVSILLLFIIFVSCKEDSVRGEKNRNNVAPISHDINPTGTDRSREIRINLNYKDSDNDQAESCRAFDLNNLSLSSSCSCSQGVCSVSVLVLAQYTGQVSFKYTVTANNQESNIANYTVNADPIGSNPDDLWVRIPANSGGMGLSEFYVMKYEAKAWNDINTNNMIDNSEVDSDGLSALIANHRPISIPENQPWRTLNASNALNECESLGPKYHLISNSEWMAIARNIESVDANWTGGKVGNGCLFNGNSNDTSCGYNAQSDPDSGRNRNSRAKHSLSNGAEIYDMAANLFEWTDWNKSLPGYQSGVTTCPFTGNLSEAFELPDLNCGGLSSDQYNSKLGQYNSSHGMGKIIGGSGGGAIRGGVWVFGKNAGIYGIYFSYSPTIESNLVGFRCVYRP